MDVGSLDVRRKPTPEGFYKGIVQEVKWNDSPNRGGVFVKKAKVRILILTDNPNVDESTKGRAAFDNLQWTQAMAWRFGSLYAACNGLYDDDDDLADMTPEKFEKGIVQKEVYFDVVHKAVPWDDGIPRTMENLQNYRSVE